MKLLCFGLSYTSLHLIRGHRDAFASVAGTVRLPEKKAALEVEGIRTFLFDGSARDPAIDAALAEADVIVHSIPPGPEGDFVLAQHAAALAERKPQLLYLSTIGVYGDRKGAWTDEDTPTEPESGRSRARQETERAWLAFAAANAMPLTIFRLAGIYGPGRNALAQLRAGTAKRIIREGQVFNRIHVEDISRALLAAVARPQDGAIYNLADDEPSPPQDVVTFAAELMGIEPPPEIPFEEAALTPMAASFWGEVKRAANAKAKRELGWVPLYPSYREGVRALWEDGEVGERIQE